MSLEVINLYRWILLEGSYIVKTDGIFFSYPSEFWAINYSSLKQQSTKKYLINAYLNIFLLLIYVIANRLQPQPDVYYFLIALFFNFHKKLVTPKVLSCKYETFTRQYFLKYIEKVILFLFMLVLLIFTILLFNQDTYHDIINRQCFFKYLLFDDKFVNVRTVVVTAIQNSCPIARKIFHCTAYKIPSTSLSQRDQCMDDFCLSFCQGSEE